MNITPALEVQRDLEGDPATPPPSPTAQPQQKEEEVVVHADLQEGEGGEVKKEKVLDSLNPTGGLLVEYTPEERMKIPLGDNITTLAETMNKSPDSTITIYRGSPKSQKEINAGDFITTDREIALSYTGEGNVISKEVKLGDILDDVESSLGGEYIYRPKASEELKSVKYDYTKSEWFKNYTEYLIKNKETFNNVEGWISSNKASGKTKQQLTEVWNSVDQKTKIEKKLYHGEKGKVVESTKTFDNVLTIEKDQRELLSSLAEKGDARAKEILGGLNVFTEADVYFREKYSKEGYDAIEYKNSHEKEKGVEYFDLKNKKFYSDSKVVAEVYAMQNREAKYEKKETVKDSSTVQKKRVADTDKTIKEKESKTKSEEQPPSGSTNASIGRYRDDTELFLSDPSKIKPIQFPELVGLAKELTGDVPFLRRYTKANGMFYGRGTGEIGLHPSLFEKGNLRQLQATLAHEIGHLIDYLPTQTLKRGNLLGRLNTLKGFRKDFFPEAGGSRTDKELRSQMYELSKYWRPFDEANETASFKAYRKSAPEIYADFISALFNEPRTVSSIAPTAYNVFFQQLDAKPKVKEAYFELQDLLRHGDLVAKRRSDTTKMFKVTEQESRERQIQDEIERESREKSIWFKFKTQGVDITEVVKEAVVKAQKDGRKINPDDNPTYYLEERNYLGGKISAEVDTKFNSIYQELQKDDMTWEDLGELMFYERVLKGDRKEVANPLGFQPDFVQELMEVYEDVGSVKPDQKAHEKGTSDMKSTLGEDKFKKLQSLATEYRDNLRNLFQQGREEGIYSAELEQMFKDNAFYVPFKGAKYSGVSKTTFGVKQQKGTLGNIENPANTGIEKGVSIIRAIERNKVTRKTIDFYQEYSPNEVTKAKTDENGYPIKPMDKDLDLVTYMKDGKVKGFYVDKYISDAIKNNTVGEQNLIIGSLRFFNSGLFRPLFITFNLGFQAFNAIRDFKRFWKNVPNMTILKAMKLYSESARASKIRAFGLPKNPTAKDKEAYNLINKLEEDQILSITYNDIIKGEAIEDAQIERILREVGIREGKDTRLGKIGDKLGISKNTPIIKQLTQMMDFIEKTGNMIETLPKVAGVKALENKMEAREMRSFVRRYVGSPDFLAGGKWKPVHNEVFLFSNAIFQGIRSDYEIATRPKSRGAYWMKTAQTELVPKMLMMMAVAGLFGDELEELFNKVGEYDMTNYTVIPLGIDNNGKAVYFRLPSDESGRLIGGMFWKMMKSVKDPKKLAEMKTYTDLVSYAGGQVPTVTPAVEVAGALKTFLAGENPYDFFRGRHVLTDDQQKAGGMERVKPFMYYMFQQLGGNVFMKLYYNETVPKTPSLSEKIVSLPVISNIAGRFIKTSNYGEVEKIREISNQVRSDKAREGIANRRTVFSYVDQARDKSYAEAQALKKEMIQEVYGGFPKTPEERNQARNLERRFEVLRLRGTADARIDALVVSQSNDEKVALLQEYEKTMSQEDFDELKKFIIKNRVVSSAVFQLLNRIKE